jgi:hypothetical protein
LGLFFLSATIHFLASGILEFYHSKYNLIGQYFSSMPIRPSSTQSFSYCKNKERVAVRLPFLEIF